MMKRVIFVISKAHPQINKDNAKGDKRDWIIFEMDFSSDLLTSTKAGTIIFKFVFEVT